MSDTRDIVEELNAVAIYCDTVGGMDWPARVASAAAAEIRRLRAELTTARMQIASLETRLEGALAYRPRRPTTDATEDYL